MARLTLVTEWFVDGSSADSAGRTALTVENDRIASVEPVLESAADDAMVFDDATALPGLIDCHVHLPFDASADPVAAVLDMPVPLATLQGVKNAQTILRQGTTTVRDVSSPHGISLALRDAIAAGWFDGPDVLACGTHITITGGHGCAFGLEVDSVDEVRKAVRSQIKVGADLIKVMETGGVYSLRQSPDAVQFVVDELRAAVEIAHEAGITVACHAEGTAGIRTAIEAGVDTIEHGNHLTAELARQMHRQGTVLVPTVGAFKSVAASTDLPGPFLEKGRELVRASEQAVRLAHEHDVPVATGTDLGTAMHLPWAGNSLAKEVRYLVELGEYSPMDAVRSATSRAADVVGLGAEVGTLEAGKLANVLVVQGNPAKDVTALERPLLVVKHGRVVWQAPSVVPAASVAGR